MTTTATAGRASAPSPAAARGSAGWQSFMRVAFHVVAIIEAITWTGLLWGMQQRYIAEAAYDPVPLWGMLHGIAFMVFCGVVVLAWWTFRWRFWELLVAIAMAIPPLLTVPLEIWYARTGRLKPRS